MRLSVLLFLIPTIAARSAHSQNGGQPPKCDTADHRAFDFWLGDWTVTDSARTTVYGTNNVTSAEHGCILHEHWVGARGGSGQSFNYYDRQRDQWEQLWIDGSGGVLRLAGSRHGAAMVLRSPGIPGDSTMIVQEIRWAPQPDGRVRQTWRQSKDGGATWSVAFDGWYARKAESDR